MACPCCGGTARIRYCVPRLGQGPADSQPHNIWWCESCDFGFLHPRPTAQQPDRTNDSSPALSVEKGDRTPTFLEKLRCHLAWRFAHAHARQIDAPLIHSYVGAPSAPIGVFGCTQIELMAGLRDLGHPIVGIECKPEVLDRVGDRGFEVLSGSLLSPPLGVGEASLAAVILLGKLDDCLDPRLALENVHRLLAPGGHLFAEVPNHQADSARRLGPAWGMCDAGCSVSFFTGPSLARFALKAGFRVKDTLYRKVVPQFSSSRMLFEQEKWDWLYANVPREDRRLPVPPRNSTFKLWTASLRLAFQRPPEQFEIVGLVGTKNSISPKRD